MNVKLGKRTSFESNAEECIKIIKKYNIKYISFWDNMTLEIVFHPNKNDCLSFDIDLDVLNNWSWSLDIMHQDLIKIAEEFNLPDPIIGPSMYSTDGSANVIHSNPLNSDYEFQEMRMEIPTFSWGKKIVPDIKVESFRKFENKPINHITVITDEISINNHIYIDFESYPSKEFETIGDMVASITIKDAKDEDIDKVIQRLNKLNLPIEIL